MLSTEKLHNIQRLIWLYFWLLIFEGALRKWVLPQFSTPLLIIRDPVVIGAYCLAIKQGVFPKNFFTKIIIILGFISFIGGLFTVVTSDSNLIVTLFGLRTNFLHLPLIFLIPKVFNLEDVNKLGKWVLLLAIPMAILMIYQFESPPDALINRTVGLGEGQQIGSALGKIRTPGTFSFITGAAQYFSLVASFLLYGLIQSKIYPNWLLASTGLSLVSALAVSGSRSALGLAGVVMLSFVAVMLIRPNLAVKSYKFLLLAAIVYLGLYFIPSFSQGVTVLNSRIETANSFEASNGGIVGRFLGDFWEPFQNTDQIPLLGYGLGMGTNAGSALLTGKVQYLLSEGEWGRILFESGLILGLLYIVLRITLVGWISLLCIKSTSNSNILPLLLFASCAISLVEGQFGQPTTLGFTVLEAGLCLAACRNNNQQFQPR